MSIRYTMRRLALGFGAAGAAGGVSLYSYWTDAKFKTYSVLGKIFLVLDPEESHEWGIWAASRGFLPKDKTEPVPQLQTKMWGKHLPNPIGLAAGFDKNAEAMEGMLAMGFGFVEIGSVTPLPQEGNPKPRVFRLPELRGVINRYGFNSDGVDAVKERLHTFRTEKEHTGVLGVNLGVNKENASDWHTAAADYCIGVEKLSEYADYVVINVSSPNTQGLRGMQSRNNFRDLIKRVRQAMDRQDWGEKGRPPLFVKIAPDLSQNEKEDIGKLATRFLFDGLIVSNTTISRPDDVQKSKHGGESGGLSGAPLSDLSTKCVGEMYVLTKGAVPIIGCGGISSGQQAYEKIRAGASLVQLYTGLVYDGPHLVPKIKSELLECLTQDGFRNIEEAVGVDHRKN
ncbi:hypothetical protein BSKO_01126 [Bryopsis sp. KO-2023]|nr:hypothetical protein BSKO_01126 [Bryopsis sp. KO-2023]